MRDLALLPTAHLHVHLESTVRPSTLTELAADAGVPVPPSPTRYPDFGAFAASDALVRDCLRRPEDFARVAREFCADQAAAGTHYVEVTVTAAGHGERLRDPEMPLEAVLAGLRDGEECGPASIRDALAVGCADRIGHGIRALEDPDLVAELRERRIPLEWLDPPREVRPA